MIPEELLQKALKQLNYLKIAKGYSEEGLQKLVVSAANSSSSILVFWSKLWEYFRIKEQDIINIYRQQKVSFQKFFDAMSKKRMQGSTEFPQEEIEILAELEQLLRSDDLLLNSSHIILILRTMAYLKEKRNDFTSNQSSRAASVDRHRYIGLHLVILLEVRMLMDIQIIDSALTVSFKSKQEKLESLMEKYKPILDHDTSERDRLQTSLHFISFTVNRIESLVSSADNDSGSGQYWWSSDIRSIVEDMILVLRCAAIEKLNDPNQTKLTLPLSGDLVTEEKVSITNLFEKLVSQEGKEAHVEITTTKPLNPTEDSSWLDEFLFGIEFGGIVEDDEIFSSK